MGSLSLSCPGHKVTNQTIGAGTPDLVIHRVQRRTADPLHRAAYSRGAILDLQGTWSSDDTANIPRFAARQHQGPSISTTRRSPQRQGTVERGVRNAEENATSTFRSDFARRAFRQTSIIVDPPDGVQPQATAVAQKRAAPRDQGTFGDGPFNSVEDFTNYDRCITRGIWGSVMRVIYGNGNRIVQAPGMVAITYEMIHDTRVFYTDGRPHIGDAIRQYLGDSRARWDGDTLVVETTNLTDKTSIGGNGNGLRHSDKMKIVEKIKRVAPDIVQYQITVDDPVTYPRPFTASFPLTPLDGGVLLPYDCHEGNLAVRQSLGAERAEDAALAADLAKGIQRARRPGPGRRRWWRPRARRGRGSRRWASRRMMLNGELTRLTPWVTW